MKITFLIILLFFISIKDFSQTHSSAHATQFQLEFAGPGIFSSLNIDSRFAKKENGLGFRLGIGITPLNMLKDQCNTGSLNSFPIGINYLIGKNKHLFEVAGGAAFSFMSGTKLYCSSMAKHFFSEETTNYWFTSIGYRYQPFKQKGFTYRAFHFSFISREFSCKTLGRNKHWI
jgi:hypothetical protein